MASNYFKILIAGKLTRLKPEANLISITVGKDQNFQGKCVLMDALLVLCPIFTVPELVIPTYHLHNYNYITILSTSCKHYCLINYQLN